jgi:hypothetical protein
MANHFRSSDIEALRLVASDETDSTRGDSASSGCEPSATGISHIGKADPVQLSHSGKLLAALERIADALERMAPPPGDIVDARYIADRLGCSTEWVAKQAREGRIPTHCIVQGTGNGKPWKFYGGKINKWIESR